MARSAGQHLTHSDTGIPMKKGTKSYSENTMYGQRPSFDVSGFFKLHFLSLYFIAQCGHTSQYSKTFLLLAVTVDLFSTTFVPKHFIVKLNSLF